VQRFSPKKAPAVFLPPPDRAHKTLLLGFDAIAWFRRWGERQNDPRVTARQMVEADATAERKLGPRERLAIPGIHEAIERLLEAVTQWDGVAGIPGGASFRSVSICRRCLLLPQKGASGDEAFAPGSITHPNDLKDLISAPD
jgi:hypothetical protein